jgi:membrane dipeptidase
MSTHDELLERARAIAHRTIIVDGHVDVPYRLQESRDAQGRITEDVTKRTAKGDFDWERAREGGHSAPFMSIYVPATHQIDGGAKKLADSLIDMVEDLAKRAPDKFALARSPSEIERNFAAGRISLPMGIENGAALEGSIENLHHFHARGVRYITLAHSKDNDLCDSSYDDRHTNHGCSALGKRVVAEMNALGMMVDVSHLSDEAFHDVLSVSRAPVIASHSSCRSFTPGWERNMSDEMIRRLAESGGIIMINFGSSFLDDRVRREREAMGKALELFLNQHGFKKNGPEAEEFKTRYYAERPIQWASVELVADHIEHAVKIGGIDHVGLGSDFDGVGDSLPIGLKDGSQLPNLVRVLLARGWSEPRIAKILSGNALRVWRDIQAQAVTSTRE